MDVLVIGGLLAAILVIWSIGIWRGYEARRQHMPRDGHKESSDPSLL
jgi:hypothetical protein